MQSSPQPPAVSDPTILPDQTPRGSFSRCPFDVATLISTVSIVTPLAAGDMIVTGTPAGVGFIRQPPRFLEPGEICTVRIEGLGALVNPVTRTPAAE
ncbi:fumarylacetoacetate hydrolase family protein [Acidithiobacillus sp.]